MSQSKSEHANLKSNYNERKNRGTSITREQHDILLNFLKFDVKPHKNLLKKAGLSRNLNRKDEALGKTFNRFRSIAKRLQYRQSDGELVFKSNSKIVLPSSRYEEVIQTVHKSEGERHLNITATLDKLSEKYTIGCRQFGICEEKVREVIRKCREGSCGKKHKPMNITDILDALPLKKEKHHDSTKKRKKSLSLSGTKTPSNIKKTLSAQQLVQPIAVNTIQIPISTYTIEPCVALQATCTSCVGPAVCIPLFATHVGMHGSSMGFYGSSLPVAVPVSMPYLRQMLGTNSVQTTGTKILPRTPATGTMPYFNEQSFFFISPITSPTLDLVTLQRFPGNHVNSSNAENTSVEFCEGSNASVAKAALSHVSNNIDASFKADRDTIVQNLSSLVHSKDFVLDTSVVNLSVTKMDTSWCSDNNANDLPRSENFSDFGEKMSVANDSVDEKILLAGGDKTIKDAVDLNLPELGPLPNPKIWHNLTELLKENNPFKRICLCIQDMKQDKMLAHTGSIPALERLRKKINVVDQLIETQKAVTAISGELF